MTDRRRLTDAATALPLVGLALFMLPLVWRGAPLALVLSWLLAVWLGLVWAARALGRALMRR